MKSPYPWFGGKRQICDFVWAELGDVPNYVEPFFGSGAVLLARPHEPQIETVNDLDGFLCNFWRALQVDPEAVAYYADWPVSEIDLHARHGWLVARKERLSWSLEDPDFYDAKMAGWWVWGMACWLGSGFCSGKGPWVFTGAHQAPRKAWENLSDLIAGVTRKRPNLTCKGQGVQRSTIKSLSQYFISLASRTARVRVVCGDWKRVVTPAVTTGLGLTGVFIDPPYSHDSRQPELYACDSLTVAREVGEWAKANEDNPRLRIILCGYEGEHEMLDTWRSVSWEARGGLANQGTDRLANRRKERLWLSPSCLQHGIPSSVSLSD